MDIPDIIAETSERARTSLASSLPIKNFGTAKESKIPIITTDIIISKRVKALDFFLKKSNNTYSSLLLVAPKKPPKKPSLVFDFIF